MSDGRGNAGEDAIRQEIRKRITELYSYRAAHKEKFIPGKTIIRYCSPIFDDAEVNEAVESLLDGWLGVGAAAARFEEELARYIGLKKAVLTNSGSSANLLAVSAAANSTLGIRIRKGDEAITPAMTFPTTINPLIQNGMKPVLVDADLGTYAVNVEQMEQAISDKTKAMMIPHTIGNPCNMAAIRKLADENNLILIEDCCDAFAAEYGGEKTGTFGQLSTFSFYASHHLSMGEGGAVGVGMEELEPVVRSFRDWGRIGAGKYIYNHIGYNLKPIELQAAMGLVQLKRADGFLKKRRENFKALYDDFSQWEKHFILPEATRNSTPSWFAFPLTIRDGAGFTRDGISQFLWKRNIENRPMFAGNIVDQPAYKETDFRMVGKLPNAEKAMKDSFFIGLYPGIVREMLDYMTESFRDFLSRH